MYTTCPLPMQTNSTVIYQFSRLYGAEYLGRMQRQLSKRIRKHNLVLPNTKLPNVIKSSNLTHLVHSGLLIYKNTEFLEIYRVLVQGYRQRFSAAPEVINIRLFKPVLCTHLPWPQFVHIDIV